MCINCINNVIGDIQMIYEDKELIAKKLKAARERAGLTQEELAEKINVSSQHVSRMETGMYMPSFLTFLRMAEELNLTLSDFGVKTEKKENKTLNEFIKLLYILEDNELEYYYNITKAQIQNMELFLKNKNKKNY